MIQISAHICLSQIKIEHHVELYHLMKRIYPSAYHHYWKDSGKWYVNNLYNQKNIEKDLAEKNSSYYFVLLDKQIVGIFRIVYHVNSPLSYSLSY